jgi:DNA polymerase I-like protein with 3'-5' exonuclease and polymerase domains
MSFGLSLIERETSKKPWMENYNFVLIQDIDHLEKVILEAINSPYCAFDLESTGLDTRVFNGTPINRVVGYSLAYEKDTCYYIPIRHKVETSRGKNLDLKKTNELIQKLVNEAVVVGHNWLKFDAEMMLASDNIYIKKFKLGEPITYHDSYILARLAGYKAAGLKALSKKLLDKEMIEINEVVSSNRSQIDFGSVSPYEGLIYAASDAICTKEIFEHPTIQKPIEDQKFIYNLERKLIYVVRKMERNKIKLNVDYCQKLDEELVLKIEDCVKKSYDLVSEKTQGKIKEFKLDSPTDVADILFNIFDMNPKPEKGKNGEYTTNDETLEKLASKYELAKILQDYRMYTKFHRTYIKNMLNNADSEGYLKFQFSSLQTDTGRFASPGGGKNGDGCSGVNIQAIPARYDKTKPNIRKCLSCEDDEVIVAMDWAGVELRVAANMSLEPIWLDRFLNGDGDLHTSTASIIYDKPESDVDKVERQTGKCVDPHSLMYVNGKYVRIGNLHSGRDLDKFYDVTSENYEVKISKTENSKIKNFYSNGPAERYLVVSRRGVVVSSAKHRFELEDKSLVKAIDLKKGDVLDEVGYGLTSIDPVDEIYFNPFLKTQSDNKTFSIKINTDLAYILGLFTGDGGSSKNACCIHTGGHGKYLEWADTVKKSLEKIGLDVRLNKVQVTKQGHMNRKLYFGSRHTIQVFQQLEVINENFKKSLIVPDFILNAREEVKLAFIGGLIDTDGCVSKKSGSIDFTTKSWKLAQDMCVLLASLNMHYSLEATYNKTYNKYYFRIRIAKISNSKIRPYIKCPWKLERVSDPVFKYTKFPKNKVSHVIPLDAGDLVDIEVEHESHMYLVNNLRTHNTFNFQSVYGGGPGALATTIGISIDDAREKQGRFFGRLQTLRNFIKNLQKNAQKNHFCVTRFGRKRYLPEYKSDNPKDRAGADRQSVNTPIQGTAADLMKLAMVKIDEFIEDNSLSDYVKMIVTMHDELCFRIKKSHIDVIPKIEEVMKLQSTLDKISWKVPLAVDVEIGSSWDVEYEMSDMLSYIKEKYNQDNISFIYKKDQNYLEHLKNLASWKEIKKEEKKNKEIKKEMSPKDKVKEDFKKIGNNITKSFEDLEEKSNQELKNKTISNLDSEFSELNNSVNLEINKENLILNTDFENDSLAASASNLDRVFKILNNASLSDLPLEAHQKLKKSFYEEEIERILSGYPSTEDEGVELPLVVHYPIDEMKKVYMGVILDTCKGKGRIKFVNQDMHDLGGGWFEADVLKASVMAKIFNL